MSTFDRSALMDRRAFLRKSAFLGSLAALQPLHALGRHAATGAPPPNVFGYGPLVDKGDLLLPVGFNYQIISSQGKLMSDGQPTPGIFDGMGAFPQSASRSVASPGTILIRNHENRELDGEQKVVTGSSLEYDHLALGGNTKLVVERRKTGQRDPDSGRALFEYNVVEDFAILGGTSTNCAGGEMPFRKWITCEETVKRSVNGKKHGYIFEIDARAPGPLPAVPVFAAGRMVHEATAWREGILYQTEDRGIDLDPLLDLVGACFYRFIPRRRQFPSSNLAFAGGTLQALKLANEFHANMDAGREVGVPYPVEWVTVNEPDHEDDTDNRRDRVSGFTPTRIQAQDKGAAFFDRLEGMWAVGAGSTAKVYFDCTSGGAAKLGQVWEYDLGLETITLIYESTNSETLRNPDNVVIVPQTRDIFLCEDAGGMQFIRGLTPSGAIYDFARTNTNQTEFCGACFDRGGHTLYVNQQGARGVLPDGPPGARAVTYAIYGPFRNRLK
jgi:secreted PhoX family phosphatase